MNTWIISGIILLIGFLICLFLILRNKWKVRKKHINDYEEGRDKLTPEIQKANEKILVQEEEYSGGFGLSSIIGAFISLIIGVSLIGPINEQVKLVASEQNVTGVSSIALEPILNLIPIFFAIAIFCISISVVYNALRREEML